MAQTVIQEPDPQEKPGARPYEMVWAGRAEPTPPSLPFGDLAGWRVEVANGAEGEMRPSRAQDVWGRPVARLRYKGAGPSSPGARVTMLPPRPVPLPADADCVEMWVFGNRWDWVNPPDTPPTRIGLRLRDANGQVHDWHFDTIRWEEWWLLHRRLPALARPAVLEAVTLNGGWQPDWRTVYIDALWFLRERLAPLTFAPRPARNLVLARGQPVGANTGPGRLPFPTRDDTILPEHLAGAHRTAARRDGSAYVFTYTGSDCAITYRFDPARGLGGITASVGGASVGRLMVGAAVTRDGSAATPGLTRAGLSRGVAEATYDDGTTLRLKLRQKSLVIDVRNTTGRATGLALGELADLNNPRTIWMPYITLGGSAPTILLSRAGNRPVFTSVWVDWYRTNASEMYAVDQVAGRTARINGGTRYTPRTDGKRNPLFERVFVTCSPMLEEVLPVISNPVGLHARQAVDQLWQETWGPADYEQEKARGKMLRAYGIEELIQCNHEIAWRDGGESFTLRTRSAPVRGGDEALQRFVAHQRSLGWFSGLYTNYTDFAPVNEHWSPDAVQRQPDGEWRAAWPRNYALKPLAAVQFDALLAPQVAAKYRSNSGYTDVHTAVSPWGYCDYDARVPGAGTLAQTFYAYGELLRNDSRVYGGPIFSEGTYHWLYAGLADGNYALGYGSRALANEPLMPVFDLLQVHTRECDIGMGWTANFCDAIPDWHAPQNIDRAIDRFILNTMAYGHIGWLVEEAHGIARTCRSYYMLQQVQARYGLKRPTRIAYWDGRALRSVSQAVAADLPRTRRQLYVEYPGLRLWLNDSADLEWPVTVPGVGRITLPPSGWAACDPAGSMTTCSAMMNGHRADYLRSASYTYLDGRGTWFSVPDGASNGALAIRRGATGALRVTRISGTGPFVVRRPYGAVGTVAACRTYGKDGKRLADARVQDSGAETWVHPVEGATSYVLRFTGRRTWTAHARHAGAAPGAAVPLSATSARPVVWTAEGGTVKGSVLYVPADTPVGGTVTARARVGSDVREVVVAVIAPVQWAWSANPTPGGTALTVVPTWRVAGLPHRSVKVHVQAPVGWTAEPAAFDVDPSSGKPLHCILRSEAPAGASGELTVTAEGLAGAAPLGLVVERAPQHALVNDLAPRLGSWGIRFRGGEETPNSPGTGAVCHVDAAMAVGGVSRPGIFMHPPYNGGVGYTWAALTTVNLPADPCQFRAWVGLRDGGDASDGVTFVLQAVEPDGRVHRLAQQTGVQGRWTEMTADLGAYAGRSVQFRLVADVGPADNSAADWACWGEPHTALARPATVTYVKEAPRP